ncbi:MAG: hypothetical protein AAGB93_20055 [Planctomycetota bacterium]
MHHLVPAAGLALLAASGPSDLVSLISAPREGLRLEREITRTQSMVSSDLSVVMGGQEVPQGFLPDLTIEVEVKSSVAVRDAFVEPGDPFAGLARERTITDAGQSMVFAMDSGGYQGMEDAEWRMEGTTPLEGTPFLLGADADGAPLARWVEPESSPTDDLLEGLVPDLDLAELLPDGPIEIGARWTADAAPLGMLFQPGGDLGWDWAEGEQYLPEDPSYDNSGELELRLAETVSADGVELARIEVTGTFVSVETSATTLDEVPVADGTATDVRTTKYGVEGELLWNLALGVPHSLEIDAEGEGDQVTTRDPDQPGQDYESTMIHESSFELRYTCRAARN